MKYLVNTKTKQILKEAKSIGQKWVDSQSDYEFLELDNAVLEDGSFRGLAEEELAPYALKAWKEERQIKLGNLEVSYNDVIYQADEVSQGRMNRAIVNLLDDETINWVAKDNSIQVLTKSDLKQIARLAGQAQTAIWIKE